MQTWSRFIPSIEYCPNTGIHHHEYMNFTWACPIWALQWADASLMDHTYIYFICIAFIFIERNLYNYAGNASPVDSDIVRYVFMWIPWKAHFHVTGQTLYTNMCRYSYECNYIDPTCTCRALEMSMFASGVDPEEMARSELSRPDICSFVAICFLLVKLNYSALYATP